MAVLAILFDLSARTYNTDSNTHDLSIESSISYRVSNFGYFSNFQPFSVENWLVLPFLFGFIVDKVWNKGKIRVPVKMSGQPFSYDLPLRRYQFSA